MRDQPHDEQMGAVKKVSMVRKAAFALGAFLLIAIGAMAILPSLIPSEMIKAQVVTSVKSATGRDLSIGGKMGVSVFPALSVQVADLNLSNPPGFHAKNLVRLGALDLKLKLLPLLSGRVEIDSFRLIDPVIALEVDAQGHADWVFGASSAPAGSAAKASPGRGPTGLPLSDIHLGDIGIQNGKLSYSDLRTKAGGELEAINLNLSLKSLDDSLAAKGSLKWHAQPVTFSLEVGKPRVLIAGSGTTTTSMNINADPATLYFDGEAYGADKRIAGNVDLKVPSLRTLAAWITAKPLDIPGTGFGPFAVKGKLNAADGRIALSSATIALDAITSTGELAINTGGDRLVVNGRLDTAMLDLNPYVPAEEHGKAASAKPPGNQYWSDAAIDASALKIADLDLALKAGGVKMHKIQIDKCAGSITLRNGRLVANLTDMAFYKGTGNGTISVDGTQPGVGIDAKLALKGFQAQSFLADATGLERLSGTGTMQMQISGRGRSQRGIVSSLSGNGSVTFLNGAIKGIDIAGMIRNVTSAFTGASGSKETDFAELSGTYTIKNGILSNRDLSLKAPVLRVGGAGTVDLSRRAVQYRLEPKAVATLEGQGGKNKLAGLTVPVIIEGPWDHLSYRPDLAGIVTSAGADALKGALGGKSPKVPGIPDNLLPKF